MKKIPTLFKRDFDGNKQVVNEVNPICQWVFENEGYPTRKFDGTCVLIKDGKLYKRYEAKKEPPPDFVPAQDRDPITGHWVGWRLCDRNKPEDKYHWEAFDALESKRNGTYELIGPKVQGNPEKCDTHELIKHGDLHPEFGIKRTFDGIKEYLSDKDIEGIVFHHHDGRMCKIKKRDFGMKR